jgi:regulator of cell morphogenesis and NO signaling
MTNQKSFNEVKAEYLQTLKQYVPVVARVHGKSHPEFYDVQKLFDTINLKITKSGTQLPELKEEFAGLRKITDNYTVPGDVCESYEAVYNMLSELDQAYSA